MDSYIMEGILERTKNDDMFEGGSIHAQALFEDAHSDRKLLLEEVERLTGRVHAQENKIRQAFQMLDLYGVPMERAKTLDNGICVLATRYEKEIAALKASSLQREVQP